jgi:AcrR family transcriptional regulator
VLTAAVQIVGELGYGGMSVARITGRAGVSRRTFYDLFDDREDCFLAAFQEAVARVKTVVVEAAAGQSAWREQVRAGLSVLLGFFDNEPGLGSLVIVDALGAGPRVLERRSRVLGDAIAIIDRGRAEAKPGREPPSLTAEGIVGAVLAVIHARILEKGHPRLTSLLNPLMGMIVLPYLGQAAAAKELARPTPRVSRMPRRQQPVRDPLQGLDMRLTYRTLRVLAAIAEQPGASNRHVADTAGVHDQGQISKLLARLEHLGLIENTGEGHAKGEPNAWRLTQRGEEVQRGIGMQ